MAVKQFQLSSDQMGDYKGITGLNKVAETGKILCLRHPIPRFYSDLEQGEHIPRGEHTIPYKYVIHKVVHLEDVYDSNTLDMLIISAIKANKPSILSKAGMYLSSCDLISYTKFVSFASIVFTQFGGIQVREDKLLFQT